MLHPILDDLKPSPEQIPAITERERDVVAIAGAGSGKTRTLVARYLSLLAEGLTPRTCIAITFTKKAAREMRNRVRKALTGYLAAQPELGPAERGRWLRLYGELDAARIGTIHSLCAEILRSHPAEAGVDPAFAVLDEGQANILRGRAVDGAIAWAASDKQAARLFTMTRERELRDILDRLMQCRLDTAACLGNLPDPLWPLWKERLLAPVQGYLKDTQVQAEFAFLCGLRADGAIERARAAGDRQAEPLSGLLAAWDALVQARLAGDEDEVARQMAALYGQMDARSGQDKNWRPKNPKPSIKFLKEAFPPELANLAKDGFDLAAERRWAEAAPAWRALFEQALTIYDGMKREQRVLDFDDLEDGALRVLQAYPAALARWQGEARAILVDEFQDTNGRQRDLVAALRGGCCSKFFMVGDDKQSIYRFRGADVAVFQEERSVALASGGIEVALDVTYRAHEPLLRAINQFLQPMLGPADPDRPWRAGFVAMRAQRETPAPGFAAPHVELHLTAGSKEDGALDRAAAALAARLVDLVEGGSIQISEPGGKARRLDYGDVAVLCRATHSFEAYENAFERAGIPFLTVAGRGFYGRPEVRDLLNTLAALADPTDDVALAGLLRSPAIGMSDAGLYRLHRGRLALPAGSSLWHALLSAEHDPPGDDGQAAQRGLELVRRLHGLAGRITVAELLKAFLDATDYKAALIAAHEARGARNVAKLLADAHASGIVSVGEFLEYVAALRDADTREGEARALAEGVVQIMTIHAAKGLEFPIVVLGDANHKRSNRRPPPLLHAKYGLLLPAKDEDGVASAMYRLHKSEESEKDDAEAARLLYVAATRAQEKLILSGCLPLTTAGEVKRGGGWLSQIIGPDGPWATSFDHHEAGAAAREYDVPAGGPVARAVLYEPGWSGSRQAAKAEGSAAGAWPALPAEARAEPSAAEEEARPDIPGRVWRVVPAAARPTAPAWVVGSLVHDGIAAWQFPGEGFERWAAARGRSYGIADADQLRDAVSQARRLLLRFQDSAVYEEMLKADQRWHEVPYSLLADDGTTESRIMDALYRLDGEWTLAEFKTDEIRDDGDLGRMLARSDYVDQARRYYLAMTRLLGRPPRVVLCLLNFAGTARCHTLRFGDE